MDDCSMSLSEFLGSKQFITYEVCFLVLYLLSTAFAGFMVTILVRSFFLNRHIEMEILHKIGVTLIFLGSLFRLVYTFQSWITETLATDLIHLQRFLIPVLVSVFLFQVLLWYETAKSIFNKESILARKMKKGAYRASFVLLLLIFVLQISLDGFVIDGNTDYYYFDFVYGWFLGLSVLGICICFWVSYFIFTRHMATLKEDAITPSRQVKLAMAPIGMSICAMLTLAFGTASHFLPIKTDPFSYLIINVPLRLAEYGYGVLFLFYMGSKTYAAAWKSLKSWSREVWFSNREMASHSSVHADGPGRI
eukprot:TRINITY_DN5505_c0_g1_i2.p1 TRINITY_DN5505_c0_g1~~TRINITY_DN5505_c0_g1_i2.p1  ORF type:complete len:307 (+),score=55.88 TRINITY_DN5505_c0_g1_i2:177-1097(+)